MAGYVARALGECLAEVPVATEELAASLPREELNRIGFQLYEAFRPSVPEGVKGCGAKAGRYSQGRMLRSFIAGATLLAGMVASLAGQAQQLPGPGGHNPDVAKRAQSLGLFAGAGLRAQFARTNGR